MNGVVLVNMPFGSFRQPSLALGLLKGALAPLDVPVSVLDATLDFAATISPRVYDAITAWPAVDLLGDRIFAAALPSPSPLTADEYEAQVLAGGAPEHAIPYFGKPPLDGELRDAIRGAGAQVAELLESCLAEVLAARPLVVGFTSMSGQHAASLALAARVKSAQPGACIVIGGASCRGEMGAELLRRFPFVDAVATGEGEQALPELVRRCLAGEPIAGAPGLRTAADADGRRATGIACEARASADLDQLPRPDHGDYFARLAESPLRATFTPRLPFESSRGCWWGEKSRCSFCGQASEAMAYRVKTGVRALQELEELTRRYPACPVFVTDEIVSPRSFEDFFPYLRERIPDVQIIYLQARPTLSREQLRSLVSAGVRRLEVGIESLSTPVLTLMQKGTTALRCVQLLKWAREAGLDVMWNFLWGLPGEPPEEYERMAAMVPLITHLQPPNTVGAFRLDRFSPLFEDPVNRGLADVRPYPAYAYVYDLPAEALTRLAYFFQFTHRAPQQVDLYTAPLAARLAEWKAAYPRSMLTYADDGVKLTVDDRRPGSDPDELTVLDAEHRTLYLACDGVQTDAALAALLTRAAERDIEAGEVRTLLQPLVDQGLMLREARQYLALATPHA
ncbi:MAG: RiPP maturation radical SAM C-methyltransferase [Thermoleophilia bacterium]